MIINDPHISSYIHITFKLLGFDQDPIPVFYLFLQAAMVEKLPNWFQGSNCLAVGSLGSQDPGHQFVRT